MRSSEENPWDLWDGIKRNNLRIIFEILKGEKKEKGAESVFKEVKLRISQIWKVKHPSLWSQ